MSPYTTAKRKPKLIALMGATGSGKTTFTNLATGSQLRVGHGLQSCTAEIQTAPTRIHQEEIVLIDTPGFDDTEKPQAEILKMIAEFLKETYSQQMLLTGVIYFHRISDNRMSGSALGNYRLFRRLCGEDAMHNVIIATTMWDILPPTEAGPGRLQQLKEDFFKDACQRGAEIRRHYNTEESAKAIISSLIQTEPQPLLVQPEMADEHKSIPRTTAGIELDEQLEQLLRRREEDAQQSLAELEEATKHCRKEQEIEMMRHLNEKLTREVQGLQNEKARLHDAIRRDVSEQLEKLVTRIGVALLPKSEDSALPRRPQGHGGPVPPHPDPDNLVEAPKPSLPQSGTDLPLDHRIPANGDDNGHDETPTRRSVEGTLPMISSGEVQDHESSNLDMNHPLSEGGAGHSGVEDTHDEERSSGTSTSVVPSLQVAQLPATAETSLHVSDDPPMAETKEHHIAADPALPLDQTPSPSSQTLFVGLPDNKDNSVSANQGNSADAASPGQQLRRTNSRGSREPATSMSKPEFRGDEDAKVKGCCPCCIIC